nr:hypothetical protein [uncultured Cardiobacterium sp.]
MSGRARRNGSIPALWRHSRNYRRLGYITLLFGLLLLITHYKPVAPPAAAGHTTTTTAQYQPPAVSSVPPVIRAAPLPAASSTAAVTTATPPVSGNTTTTTLNDAVSLPKPLVAPELGELAKYRPLHDSWGERLNPDGTIPAEGFDAYYINTLAPVHLRARQHSQDPAAWGGNRYHDIPAENLGIYWVGQLHVPKTARYQFALHQAEQGWARISIDHRIIKDGEGTDMPEIELRQGVHIVEVEYRNSKAEGYTFFLALQPKMPVYTADNLIAALKAMRLPANTVAYVAATQTSKNDRSSELVMDDDNRPYILILPIGWRTWNIRANSNPPRAIIRYKEAGTVWVEGSDPPVLLWNQFIALEKLRDGEPDCICDAQTRTLQCRNEGNDDLGLFAENIRRWTGYPLAGISFGEKNLHATVPEITVTSTTIVESKRQNKRKTDEMRNACRIVRGKEQLDYKALIKKGKS